MISNGIQFTECHDNQYISINTITDMHNWQTHPFPKKETDSFGHLNSCNTKLYAREDIILFLFQFQNYHTNVIMQTAPSCMPTHVGNTDLSQPAAAVSLSSILNVSISLLMRQAVERYFFHPHNVSVLLWSLFILPSTD